MSRWMLSSVRGAALALAALATAAGAAAPTGWSKEELGLLVSLRLSQLPPAPADPSNRVERLPAAAALGERIFKDARFSRNQAVSCASCHAPERQFQDGLPRAKGVGEGARRAMPLAATSHSPWLFWDGRKDSLWSQALGPLEDGVEHGGNRARLVSTLLGRYSAEYQAVFGSAGDLSRLPADAGPLGNASERAAWEALDPATREATSRAFANLGKAVAAYERRLQYGPSRFDRYAEAVLAGEPGAGELLSAEEQRGLRLFMGPAQCATCHNGPLFSDQHFHNTGVPAQPGQAPDKGRAAAIAKVTADEFNCLGRFSDAGPNDCQELRFIAAADPGMLGAFKTPSLRNVALRPPYMHAGQFATLEEVVNHYAQSPVAAIGQSELARLGQPHAQRKPIRLNAMEASELVAFLKTLSGPLVEVPERAATVASKAGKGTP